MARFTFRLSDIGEGIAEAEIVGWHVAPGDRIEEDAPLVDMMTDKATVEIESPVSGVVVELAGQPGKVLAIGSALAVIETEQEVEAPVSGPGKRVTASALESRPEAPQLDPLPTTAQQSPQSLSAGGKVLASPAVRARAKDLGIDLSQIQPQGHHVRHADLDAFLRYGGSHLQARARPDEQVQVIGLRRRIAERMVESKRHIPHFTYVDEIDVTALEELRAQLNTKYSERPRITLLPFFITILCQVLPDFPMINAHFDEAAGVLTRHGRVHMGIATRTDGGLVVPCLRDAQDKDLWQLATEIARLAEAARSGRASAAELTGSTLTLSSLGAMGGIVTTPIINRPEVAILAPGRIIERLVPIGEGVERRKLMNLSISCDHRIIDGWDAAAFIQAVKAKMLLPATILIGR